MPNVTITNSSPNPDPAPISKGRNPNQLSLTFKTSDNNTIYTLTGLDAVLNAPSSVQITKDSSAGPYTAKSGAADGPSDYGITASTGSQYEGVGASTAQIQVDP